MAAHAWGLGLEPDPPDSSPPDHVEAAARARDWHALTAAEALEALGASREGLKADEAQRRLQLHGPNLLAPPRHPSWPRLLARQFRDLMILLLLGAALVSAFLGDLADAVFIAAILVLNALIGFVQEYRAQRAMEALQALAAPRALVVRDGRASVLPAGEVVPGDVIRLEAGSIVPADLRLLEAAALRIDEAALTGESAPAEKAAGVTLGAAVALGDRSNVAYAGTLVTFGRGEGVAVTTGMATELGRIAALVRDTPEVETPLQRRLAQLARRLAAAALVVCALVFLDGLARGEDMLLMFMTTVSLAVAAIPEALPAVVTIALALGARQLVRQRALVRKLTAVEALGSVTCIGTDKTGTLTENRMRAEAFYCDGMLARQPAADEVGAELLRAMALCSDVREGADGQVAGDPTEVALVQAAEAAGFVKRTLEARWPRVGEIPFDSERKCMTSIHRAPGGGYVSFTKGAAEVLLARAECVAASGGPRPPGPDLERATEGLARQGLRVLAVAMRRWERMPAAAPAAQVEQGLTLLGLVGLADPPREQARAAVAVCREAGIVPIMITGDHPRTAAAIADRVGLLETSGTVMTGAELAALSDDELAERAGEVRVYARVTPEQKLRIVKALQSRGELVAMTGDGVNDAPALRRAEIGVAMGLSGTEAAKEASALILLDDNFATIVDAVREGRRIYDNLRRFVRYVMATNSAEVATLGLAPLLGLPLPLLPIQILWMNLVTDSLPGLALAAEPAEADVMRRPPRPPRESVFAAGLGRHVVWVGALMAALALGTQAWALRAGSTSWQTMVFTVLCLSQLGHVMAIRSERRSLFQQGLASNLPLLGAVVLTVPLQLSLVYVPALNRVFHTEPLAVSELALALAISSVVFVAVEAEKWWARLSRPRRPDDARSASGTPPPGRAAWPAAGGRSGS